MTDAMVINTNDQDFEKDVVQADIPVLLDFWAPWCSPCRSLSPILEEIAQNYAGRLRVVKLDVEANGNVAARFGIRNIPSLKIFKNGQEVASKVGALPRQQLEAFIDSAL